MKINKIYLVKKKYIYLIFIMSEGLVQRRRKVVTDINSEVFLSKVLKYFYNLRILKTLQMRLII